MKDIKKEEVIAVQNIIQKEIGEIFPEKYINYAISVIVDRALSNVLDGLKPVQRRILYSMFDLGLYYNKPYKKSARVVGEVLGKYHPHGDQSVYDAAVKMAQSFNMRYPLIDGHGNWGSVDGDGAAAMRYTEARLSKIGQYILNDIRKNTVDFKDNYDGEEQEPVVLPTLLPLLLMNGTDGIAVGMRSCIPPHNIKSLYKACYLVIENTKKGLETDIEDLIEIVKAPDFPTGGTIIGLDGVKEFYRTGKGRIVLRGKYEIEETKKGSQIIITELPYKINKLALCNYIDGPAKEKNKCLQGISEVIDESDKEGMRIVIKVKKGENPNIIINNLLKDTKLQTSISCNMLALDNKTPEIMNLKVIIEHFLAHAASVIIRKTEFSLKKDNARLNLVNGILRCIENREYLEETLIPIILKSESPKQDFLNLDFNEAQIDYIFGMKVENLTRSSTKPFIKEKEELSSRIAKYNAIINDQSVLLDTIKEEFEEIEAQFGDERKTSFEEIFSDIDYEDLVKDETLIITYTTDGIIKAVEEGEYKSQRRGGKGVKATNTKDDEIIKFMLASNSRDDLLFFTTEGRCHTLKAFKIGKSTKAAKGKSINNYLSLNPGEKVISVLNTSLKDKTNNLLFVTKLGQIKKLSLEQLSTRFNSTKVINFKEGDSLVQAILIEDNDTVLIATSLGMSIRIKTEPIRSMGRLATGVRAIKLKDNDSVVDMCILKDNDEILTVTENGLAKITSAKEWRIINKGGRGITLHGLNEKTGEIISCMTCSDQDELFIATEQGLITRIKSTSIRKCGRNASGVKVINLNNNDKVVSVSTNKNEEDEDDK